MVTCLTEPKELKEASNLGTGELKQGYEKIRGTTKTSGFFLCIVRICSRLFLLASLVQTSGCHGCGGDQVTWRSDSATQNDTCLPCIDCPDGMEPSIRCGAVAKHGTDLHCVTCTQGTYSDTYGKDQCRQCSLCSKGRPVKRNCSATQNTVCGSGCSYGYYHNSIVSNCLPCSICCWDGKDQIESQCRDQGLPSHRWCRPRHIGRCEPSTTVTKGNTRTGGRIVITSPTTMKKTAHTRKTTPSRISVMVQLDNTKPLENKSAVVSQSLSTVTGQLPAEIIKSTQTTLSHHAREKNRETSPSMHFTKIVMYYGRARKSVVESSENKMRVIMAAVFSTVTLLLIVAIIKRDTIAHYLRWMKCRPVCRSRDPELDEGTESTVVDESRAAPVITVPEEASLRGVLCPLRLLKSVAFEAFEKLWKRLDKLPEGTNKGDFRTVAKEFKFAQEDIWELEKEFKTSGSGSPSRQLLEVLETRQPELTVFEFIKVLQKPNIRRDDIINILKDYVFNPIQ